MFIFNYTGIKIYFRLPAFSLYNYRMAITYRYSHDMDKL